LADGLKALAELENQALALIWLKPQDLYALPLSHGRPLEPLVESIKSLGLLRPLWVAQDQNHKAVIVSGSRRLEALKLLKVTSIPCQVPFSLGPAPSSTQLLLAAITDNLERGFNLAELTLVWNLAKKEAPQEAWPSIAGLLGFKPQSQTLLGLEQAALLPRQALDLMAKGAFDPENALALAAWPGFLQEKILELISRLGPSKQNRRLWLDWLSDLRDSQGDQFLNQTLNSSQLTALSGPQAEKKARDYLRCLRFPYLSQLTQLRKNSLKALALPENFKLELDQDFEDVLTTIKLTFSDAQELKALATLALKLSEGQCLENLWALKDGPW
jgi:ParB-like chromosome segregation protein Spo0J